MMATDSTPTVLSITRQQGVAGHYSYIADVQYSGEDVTRIEFLGHTEDRAIVMVTPAVPGGRDVRNPERFGNKLDEAWVRKFVTFA